MIDSEARGDHLSGHTRQLGHQSHMLRFTVRSEFLPFAIWYDFLSKASAQAAIGVDTAFVLSFGFFFPLSHLLASALSG